ncbi:MAG: S-ribosylhomocysteine lyase [Spirochaetales bacterium]|nr:S-ribosylhomocysteine lyase [Spirochaetales bacterium]
MEKIPSFTIDHNKLLRGLYVSRKDSVGSEVVTTFDIRMKEPNREPVMDMAPLHTIEHLGATFLRNDPEWKARIIYFGPMGCRTGNYLLLRGDLESAEIVQLVTRMFEFIRDYVGAVPGTEPEDCGNCLEHNLAMAKWESDKFLNEVLYKLTDDNLNYPQK